MSRPFDIAIAIVMMLLAGVANAQSVDNLDQVDSDTILAQLSDADLRALVSKRLSEKQSNAEAHELPFNPAIPIWRLQRKVAQAKNNLTELLKVRGRLKSEFSLAWAKVTGKRENGSFGRLIVSFLLAFGIAWLVERLIAGHFLRFTPPPVADRSAASTNSDATRLGYRLSRLGVLFSVALARIFIFALLSTIVMIIVLGNSSQDQTIFFFYLGAIIIVRAASAFASLFYARHQPDLRLPLYNDDEAGAMHRGLVVTFALTSFAFFTCALLGTMGVTTDAHPLLLLTVGNLYVVAFCLTVFWNRKAIVHDLTHNLAEQNALGSLRGALSVSWPWVVIVAVVVIWLMVAFSSLSGAQPLYGAAFYTTWVFLFYPTLDAAFERESMRATANREDILSAVMRVLRFVGITVVVISIAVGWRVNILQLDDSTVAAKVIGAVLQIMFTLLIAYVAWQTTRIWVDRKIAEEDAELLKDGQDPAELEIGGTGLSRTRTLLPILRMTVLIFLGMTVLMLLLSALGINIAPVLAGAGVLGLAIGFGSQTLVRDIVSGGFFLIDDAFRLGEYVDVGSVKGTVEKIQMRSLRLRHHRGAVHTIPFGEIAHLTNYSRDWAIMKLKFRVPFDTDIEKVRKVLKKVGQSLLEHPDIGEDFLQPFKSQGVLEVDDYGLVVRAKFMCKPGAQFLIRRHAYTSVQKAFQDNDIDFAQPEIRVVATSDDDDEDLTEAAIAAAKGGSAVVLKPNPAAT